MEASDLDVGPLFIASTSVEIFASVRPSDGVSACRVRGCSVSFAAFRGPGAERTRDLWHRGVAPLGRPRRGTSPTLANTSRSEPARIDANETAQSRRLWCRSEARGRPHVEHTQFGYPTTRPDAASAKKTSLRAPRRETGQRRNYLGALSQISMRVGAIVDPGCMPSRKSASTVPSPAAEGARIPSRPAW